MEKNNSTQHKFLADIHGVRLLYIEELSEKEADGELLKDLVCGEQITNQVMYGTTESIHVSCKLILLSNHVINLEMNEKGSVRRFKQVDFLSDFDESNVPENPKALKFKKNKDFKSEVIKKKYAFIDLLMDYAFAYHQDGELKPYPEEFEKSSSDTKNMNANEVKTFIEEHIEKGDEDDEVSMHDICQVLNWTKDQRDYKTKIKRLGLGLLIAFLPKTRSNTL